MAVGTVMPIIRFARVLMTAMIVPAGCIRAVLRLKGLFYSVHDQVHGAQHGGQHVVGLNLQVIGLEFNRHMPVAQVVGGADQIKRRAVFGAMGNAQHGLRRCYYFDERAVFSYQHVATACHGATRQEDAKLTTLRVGGVKAAFLAHVPIQLNTCSPPEQYRGQAFALRHEFGSLKHVFFL